MTARPSYEFSVPGLPVPKARPRFTGTICYTPARTKAHERLVWVCACKAGVRRIDGPVAMTLTFWLSRPDSCDLDNMAKTVLDALNGTAYADDRQVIDLHLVKRRSDDPHTDVVIYPTAGEE